MTSFLRKLRKIMCVRLASEQAFLNSDERQKQLYDEIKDKTAQVIAIQEYIYQQLKNVNSALTQSKKLIYLYQYLGKGSEQFQ